MGIPAMFGSLLHWAVIFLIISLIAGAAGLTNISVIAKRISMVLFALFFLAFLALLGFAWLVGEAISANRVMWLVSAFV